MFDNNNPIDINDGLDLWGNMNSISPSNEKSLKDSGKQDLELGKTNMYSNENRTNVENKQMINKSTDSKQPIVNRIRSLDDDDNDDDYVD